METRTDIKSIAVLVVEDEAAVREGVCRLISGAPDMKLVAACATGGQAIEAAERAPFDVALLDLQLPDRPGAGVAAALRRLRPEGVVVAFTIFDDLPSVIGALRCGARGYLRKGLTPEQLLAAIREASNGGAPITAAIARQVLDELLGDAPTSALTDREREVLGLLAKGMSYPATASLLGIGLGTVQGYVKSIYRKLEVDSKAEAAIAASRLGIL